MRIEKLIPVAEAYAKLSKDPNTQVAALLVDSKGRVRAQGFNGFPRGIKDDERLSNKETKLPRIVHAEMNCIASAAAVGVPTENCALVVTRYPCHECAKLIISAGIKFILCPEASAFSSWVSSTDVAEAMFAEAGIEVQIYGEEND